MLRQLRVENDDGGQGQNCSAFAARGQQPWRRSPVGVKKRWQPQTRAKARKKTVTTDSLAVFTRVRFGFTAAVGDGRWMMPGFATSPRRCCPPTRISCSPLGSKEPTSSSSSRSRPTPSTRCTSAQQQPRARAGRGVHRRRTARQCAVGLGRAHRCLVPTRRSPWWSTGSRRACPSGAASGDTGEGVGRTRSPVRSVSPAGQARSLVRHGEKRDSHWRYAIGSTAALTYRFS